MKVLNEKKACIMRRMAEDLQIRQELVLMGNYNDLVKISEFVFKCYNAGADIMSVINDNAPSRPRYIGTIVDVADSICIKTYEIIFDSPIKGNSYILEYEIIENKRERIFTFPYNFSYLKLKKVECSNMVSVAVDNGKGYTIYSQQFLTEKKTINKLYHELEIKKFFYKDMMIFNKCYEDGKRAIIIKDFNSYYSANQLSLLYSQYSYIEELSIQSNMTIKDNQYFYCELLKHQLEKDRFTDIVFITHSVPIIMTNLCCDKELTNRIFLLHNDFPDKRQDWQLVELNNN